MAITIGLPFYNAAPFLADAIKSVFAQTYSDWELILIDDGSTDNSLAIAKSIDDPRVRVYSDGKNKKLASRLNEIITLAKYDIIARMDADDLIAPTRLERQLQILKNNPNIDLVSTGIISITNDLKIIGKRGNNYSNINLEDLLYKRKSVVHAAIIGKKSWFKRNRYDTSLKIAQDYELWLRAASKNDFNIQVIENPLYYYREEGNATYKKLKAAYRNERNMYKKYAGKHKFKLITKSYLKSIVIFFLNHLNRMDILLNKRSSNLQNKILEQSFKKDLQIIKNTKIKGLENLY